MLSRIMRPSEALLHGVGEKHRKFTVAFAALLMALICARGERAQNAPGDSQDVLAHLNAAINWYKDLTTKVPAGAEASDSIYLNNAENLGSQVVRLAFQSARAQVELQTQPSVSKNGQSAQPNQSSNSAAQRYAQTEQDVSQRIADDESQIAALKQQGATKAKRAQVASQLESLQGKLDLDKASLDAVRQMKNFVENNSSGETGLKGSINDLARSVPEVLEATVNNNIDTSKTNAQAAAATKVSTVTRSGLLGQLLSLYGEMQSIRGIEQLMEETDNVHKIASSLRGPLRDQISGTLQKEKDLATQTGVTKEQYAALTQQFKNISAALLPLSEELVVLDQSRSNLLQWRKAHTSESQRTLISIISRVALILISIGFVLGLAEVWRRLTFRYIHDPKRRRQFLVLRRFVTGFLISLVIILGFASEFSSLATFAGFVTAGIAVGLQTILLSVAAYFFVIGRYGISVGDRISVAGVTGDVIDVGLVRFYLMEFASAGADLFPTGRIVVFSNAVLFQATTPLFKQLPGTRYTWHEVVLQLAPKADYEPVQKALEAAVSPIYKEYNLDRLWHSSAFDSIDIAVNPPAPEHRVQFAESGPELVARYPVDLNRATEIDEKITRALMDAIYRDEKLAASVNGVPRIRPAVKT
jgi:small-conductance mechanosensitive channel